MDRLPQSRAGVMVDEARHKRADGWASPLARAPVAPGVRALQARRRTLLRRICTRVAAIPAGARYAAAIVLIVHLIVATWIVPQPQPGRILAAKVEALTTDARPELIIAGDSRAACHVVPAVLADELGMPVDAIANIARPVCGPAAVLAGFRAYRARFADHPILVLSAAPWCVNDRPAYLTQAINDETLWSASLLERFRLVSVRRALNATMLPEKALLGRFSDRPARVQVAERGYYPLDAKLDSRAETHLEQVKRTEDFWYVGAKPEGIRWRILEESLRGLLAEGARVVLLDPPSHPALVDAIAKSAHGPVADEYRSALHVMAQRLDVPILSYELDDFARAVHPDEIYADYGHLNRAGAELLSRRLAADLRRMMAQHAVTPPAPDDLPTR